MRWLSLLVLLAPSSALAQPVFVEHAGLSVVDADGEHEVGWLRGGAATITGFQAGRVTLHFEDEIVTLDARVNLADEDSALSATPAQPVTLEDTGAFRIDMLPGTFARVRGRDELERLEIRLPETLPRREVAMPRGSAAIPTARPDTPEPPEDAWESICSPTRIYARPSHRAPVWIVDGPTTRAEVGPAHGGFRPVRVWIDGYLVHGYLDHALPTDVGCGGGDFSTSCGGAFRSVRTRVILPAGVGLASSTVASTFATLRVPYVASMVEAGPIPDAPTRWRIHRDDDGHAAWSLEGTLSVGPDALRSYPSAPPPP